MAAQQAQLQAQSNAQAAQVAAQMDMQKEQLKAQIEAQKIQLEAQTKAQLIELEYQYKIQIEQLRGQFGITEQQIESGVRMQADQEAENRKDQRIDKQAMAQSKLIAQRQGQRPPLDEDIVTNLTIS
jgi:outer membrane translocation and assembly module TamA